MTLSFDEPAPTLEDVWRLFRETDRKIQETEHLLQQQALQAERRAEEADRRFQETERLLKQYVLQSQRSSEELNKKMGSLNNRLGEFVESMVKPSVAGLFQQRGIPIYKTYPDVSAKNPQLGLATQIDFLVVNSDVCALIEVKSKLNVDDVNDHIERMEKFKPLFPEYVDKKAYGAVAAMVIPEDVAKYAYRKGFFVIAQKGDNLEFLNDAQFVPTAW